MESVNRKEMLLFMLDDAQSNLEMALKDLTSEEFYWKPVPGALMPEKAFEHPQPSGVSTIGFKIAHLVVGLALTGEYAIGPGKLTPKDILARAPQDFAGWMEFLKEAIASFRQAFLDSSEESLAERAKAFWGEEYPAWQIWVWLIAHNTWHAAQIRTMRALYQAKKP
ncbi:MAG: DinB family protein [bacterium]